MDVLTLFEKYLQGLFGQAPRFTLIPHRRIRVDMPNLTSKLGFTKSQSIVLSFEPYVIKAYYEATVAGDHEVLQKYAKSLHSLIKNRMVDYDPDGDKNKAFQICIDSRATDL